MPKEIEPQNLCEYYFDSRVERVGGTDDLKSGEYIEKPRLYFERNLERAELPFRLFAVVREWLPSAGTQRSELYDSVEICYEAGVTDCMAVYGRKSNLQVYKLTGTRGGKNNEHIVRTDGNILVIKQLNDFNPSGVGSIEMFKGERSVAKFYFAINCAFRKKIFYTVEKNTRNSVLINFECKNPPQGVRVRVLAHPSRLPCLTSDRDDYCVKELTLNFKRGECDAEVKLGDNIELDTGKIFVVLESEFENRYVMVAKSNCTLPAPVRRDPLRASYTCPFCHGAIDVGIAKAQSYKTHGEMCNGNKGCKQTLFDLHDDNNRSMSKWLICKNDFNRNDRKPSTEYPKILPKDFLKHTNYKIAFQGAPRAGKTTYISRFFGLKSTLKSGRMELTDIDDCTFDMDMGEMSNTVRKFGVCAEPAEIKAFTEDSGRYKVDGIWQSKEMQYLQRGMQYGRKLPSTTATDYTGYPFIVEVNNESYVSFYDIAGEDSTTQNGYIRKIAENDERTIGIFFIVTATNQDGGGVNMQVSKRLQAAGEELDPTCPVAVILTKMDAIGNRFDSSCACRRFDYYPKVKGRDFIYDGSDVEKFIDDSSEEIKAFIDSEIGGINIEKEHADRQNNKQFENVKYFCVSSFGFPESTHRDDGGDIDAESYMDFATSTRRMELPFLWMLRQFGIIK